MFWGVFFLIYTRKNFEKKIRGLTKKQVVWLSIIMIVGGALTAFLQFFTDTGHL